MMETFISSVSVEKTIMGKTSLEEKLFPEWEEALKRQELPFFPEKKGSYILIGVVGPCEAIYAHKKSKQEIKVNMEPLFPIWKRGEKLRASNYIILSKKGEYNVDDAHENTSGYYD